MLTRILVILIISSASVWAAYAGVRDYYTPASGAQDIVIYTTQWCPYCKALRNTLARYQIPYTEYDTEKSLHGFLAYQVLGRQGVPIIVLGERIYHGYDGQVLTEALADAGHEISSAWDE